MLTYLFCSYFKKEIQEEPIYLLCFGISLAMVDSLLILLLIATICTLSGVGSWS